MIKYMTEGERVEFWKRHNESRRKIDEDFAKLPFAEKLRIKEKMDAAHDAMRNAKRLNPLITCDHTS